MCFSAEASLGAAGVLGAIGYLTTKSTKENRHAMLAIIPFLFALQQLSEGVIWLKFDYNVQKTAFVDFLEYFYLTFVLLVWPIFFPFALFWAEKIRKKKIIIGVINFCGVLLSLYFFYHSFGNDIKIEILNHSINYRMIKPFPIDHWFIIGAYSLIIFLPCFISSVKLMWSYGILLMIAWILSEYLYHDTFVSTWCFFSAILSVYIYVIIRKNEKNPPSSKAQI